MRWLGWFLMVSAFSCGRTNLGHEKAGAGGTTAAGGVIAAGGVLAAGGAVGTGGATPATGGAMSTELDTCMRDADCTRCNWETTPADSSQCTGTYCCGGMVSTTKRCERNQAAWASNCPNQAPQGIRCPCIALCASEVVACVGGRCGLACPPPADAAADAPWALDGIAGPWCGDGIRDPYEQCDDGLLFNTGE